MTTLPGPGLADLHYAIRPARIKPLGALVLLHGRAVSEEDLMPLFDVLDPERRLLGVAPRGPLQFPPGGYHWYAPSKLGVPEPASFTETYDRMNAWLEQLASAINVMPHKTILGGFSQGAVLSYKLATNRMRPRPAGILAMSGFLPHELEMDPEVVRGLPVLITHGSEDPIIPVDEGRQARDRLEEAGAKVEYLESAVPHAVDPAHTEPIKAWITERIRL